MAQVLDEYGLSDDDFLGTSTGQVGSALDFDVEALLTDLTNQGQDDTVYTEYDELYYTSTYRETISKGKKSMAGNRCFIIGRTGGHAFLL